MSKQTPTVVKIFAVIIAFVIFINIVSFLWFPFLPWFEEREAGQETVEQTVDAENAIQTYEKFRRLYNEIDAQRNKVDNAYAAEEQFHETYGHNHSEWSREAETRHGRLHTRITAQQDQLENLVAEYNTMSQSANQEMFKCHLPYKVDERFAISGPPGSGEADQPVDTYPNGTPIEGEPPQAQQCDGLPSEASA